MGNPQRRRHIRIAVLIGVLVALAGAIPAYAFWRDTGTINGAELDTGTLALRVNGANPFTAFTDLSFGMMTPGASTAGVLTVTNTGTTPLDYWADAAAGNADGQGLGAALVVAVTNAATVTGTAPAATCGGTTITPSGTSFSNNLVATQADPRPLAPGASETLCIQASLPASAPASLMGATTQVAFDFHAVQAGVS